MEEILDNWKADGFASREEASAKWTSAMNEFKEADTTNHGSATKATEAGVAIVSKCTAPGKDDAATPPDNGPST